ncbi:ABC transporter substrate-binding protein [Pelistega indica]|uniref:ABC transporter substrate-binding protein n=1 Tax=Pelistega indica TaxID=1414851 RepID=V8FUT8_9BURK|nr:DctP family TRAP transporter solute-binding subunit [Pelistega indica]ETD68029.1 ABC transporter substrate-binding protein [Pelistega indica]
MKKISQTLFLVMAIAGFSSSASANVIGRLGTSLPDTHPLTLGAKKFSDLVKEKTKGEVVINVYSNGILGNDVAMTSMVQAGTLDFTTPSTATLASLEDDFTIVNLPFIFKDRVAAFSALDSAFGKSLLAKLDEHKLHGLAFFDHGFRQVTNSVRPIKTIEDMKGIKLRVMENKMFVEFFNSIGANTVAMPVNELYTALETKTVDGQENPFIVIDAKKMYEVQKYLSLTNHSYDTQVLLEGAVFMQKLTTEQQKKVEEAAREAAIWQREKSTQLGEQSLKLVSSHLQVNNIEEKEIQKFRKAAEPIWENYRERARKLGLKFE